MCGELERPARRPWARLLVVLGLLGTVTGCSGGSGDDNPAACDPDPCVGVDCGGHGTCGESDCRPYCDCADGYAVGPELDCVPSGSCADLGQLCQAPTDCCSNYCFLPGVGEPGYCSLTECADDARCATTADDDQALCCVPGPGFAFCQKIAAGLACGDRGGTCGDPCVGQLASACEDELFCWAMSLDDPAAHCASTCNTDADCEGCHDPADEAQQFICAPFPAGGRWCGRQ